MANRLGFWERITQQENGCWEWQGALSSGYGRIWDAEQGRHIYTHQRAYAERVGEIVPGHQIHHVCHNRRCCNPDHLVQMRQAEHLSHHPQALKTHCKWGHALVTGNIYQYGRQRQCRTCAIARAKGRYG